MKQLNPLIVKQLTSYDLTVRLIAFAYLWNHCACVVELLLQQHGIIDEEERKEFADEVYERLLDRVLNNPLKHFDHPYGYINKVIQNLIRQSEKKSRRLLPLSLFSDYQDDSTELATP